MIAGGIVGTVVAWVAANPGLVLLVVAPLLAVVAYYASRPRNLPPGPWGYPFFGSAHLFGNDVHWDFARLGKKYGEIYTLMMGARPMIIINSHRLIKEAFVKRGEDFANRPQMYALDYSGLTDELFNHHYTPEWKVHKKFEMRILRNHGFGSVSIEPVFQQNLDQLYHYFDSLKNKPANLSMPLARLTGSTIASVVYGSRLHFGDDELEYIIKLVSDFVDALFRVGMRWAYWTDNVHHRITSLLFPRMMRQAREATRTFQDFLIHKIHEHRETLDPDHPRDVIDGYLAERSDDPALNDVVFASTLLMMIPDAIDTTMNLFNFMVLYLAHNPGWQKEVQEQIDSVCGQRRPGLSDRSAKNLPKVEATMMEAARLGNVVCLSIAHSATHDTTLDGYTIPEDSYILANIYAAHMDENLFPQAEKFVPQRHLAEDGSFIQNDVTIPFSSGRRMCIGEQMVKNESFLFLSNTLQRYTFRFPDDKPWPIISDQGGLIRSPVPFEVCAVHR